MIGEPAHVQCGLRIALEGMRKCHFIDYGTEEMGHTCRHATVGSHYNSSPCFLGISQTRWKQGDLMTMSMYIQPPKLRQVLFGGPRGEGGINNESRPRQLFGGNGNGPVQLSPASLFATS
jgi:hypothetical protein